MGLGFVVQVTEDKLRAYAVSVEPGVKGMVSAGELVSELGRRGVRVGLMDDALDRLAAGGGDLPVGTRLLVAEGQAAEDGQDGCLEFLVDVSGRRHYAEGADGSLDFRETNLIKSVKGGERLARVVEPTEGSPGRSVFGEVLGPKAGKPVKYKAGGNVELAGDGEHLVSTVSGQPRFDGEKLWVDPVLVVSGDVDYEVGNIHFTGTVEVRGSVLDGFTVEAEGDIEIAGMAGACELRSGGDITVRSGVNGHGRARLEAGGSVRAKYLNEVEVCAGGDVEVASEVVNSEVSSLGRVLVRVGTVMGGRVVARGGVEVGTLGSELGVPTKVIFGQDYEVLGRLEEVSKRLRDIETELPGLIKRLESFSDRRKFLALGPKERERVQGEFARFKEMKVEREALIRQRVELAHRAQAAADGVRVLVNVEMHPDVVVSGPRGNFESLERRSGPLEFSEDPTGRVVMQRGEMVRAGDGQ